MGESGTARHAEVVVRQAHPALSHVEGHALSHVEGRRSETVRAFDQDVEIVIKQKPGSRRAARISVVAA